MRTRAIENKVGHSPLVVSKSSSKTRKWWRSLPELSQWQCREKVGLSAFFAQKLWQLWALCILHTGPSPRKLGEIMRIQLKTLVQDKILQHLRWPIWWHPRWSKLKQLMSMSRPCAGRLLTMRRPGEKPWDKDTAWQAWLSKDRAPIKFTMLTLTRKAMVSKKG